MITLKSILARFYYCYISYLNEHVVLQDPKLATDGSNISNEDWKELSFNRCILSNYALGYVIQLLIDAEVKQTDYTTVNSASTSQDTGSVSAPFPKGVGTNIHKLATSSTQTSSSGKYQVKYFERGFIKQVFAVCATDVRFPTKQHGWLQLELFDGSSVCVDVAASQFDVFDKSSPFPFYEFSPDAARFNSKFMIDSNGLEIIDMSEKMNHLSNITKYVSVSKDTPVATLLAQEIGQMKQFADVYEGIMEIVTMFRNGDC